MGVSQTVCEPADGMVSSWMKHQTLAEQNKFHFALVSHWMERKKEAFIGFYSTKSTEGEVLYELVKSSITELNLDLKNIVGKAFDGVANMNGVYKGLSTRMEECSPFDIYVRCYGHVLNLALQDTMTQIEPLRNALGTIQALYNFLEASPKRHALFSDTEVQDEDLKLTLKSLSTTR